MALLPILRFPDPKLKLVAEPVNGFDDKLLKICADMLETMYESDGVGLAATQVNIQQRIIVLDISEDKSKAQCLINPKIASAEGEIIWEEGCLSFPGVYANVKRHAKVTVEFYNVKGEQEAIQAEGLTAVCLQHEIDHLDGITFYDHLSSLKQQMLRKKLLKQRDSVL